MALALGLVVEIDSDSRDAAVESVKALHGATEALRESGACGCDNLAMLPNNLLDLIRCEPVSRPADGACILQRIEFHPSDRHLELVAAIAAHGNAYAVRVVHDWPILSVVARTTTVTEAGERGNASPGEVA